MHLKSLATVAVIPFLFVLCTVYLAGDQNTKESNESNHDTNESDSDYQPNKEDIGENDSKSKQIKDTRKILCFA